MKTVKHLIITMLLIHHNVCSTKRHLQSVHDDVRELDYLTNSSERHLQVIPDDVKALDSLKISLECLEAMKWVGQDRSGITSNINTEGDINFIEIFFPLDRDLSPCEQYIKAEVFYMSTTVVAPEGKVANIGDFDSRLVKDQVIGSSATPFVHFEGNANSETAAYQWIFRVPLSELNEQIADGYWIGEMVDEKYFATTIFLGLNYKSLSLDAAYLYT